MTTTPISEPTYTDLCLPLTPSGVDALAKTVSIAVSNTKKKMDINYGKNDEAYERARQDRQELLPIMADLTRLQGLLD